jgi:hypothetical protein
VPSTVMPLRPLTFGELLDAAVSLLRQHARVFLGAGLVLAAAEQALLLPLRIATVARPSLLIPYADQLGPYWLMLAGGFAIETAIIALLGGLTARAAGPALLGERVSGRQLLSPVGGRFFGVLLVAIFAGLAGGLGALAGVVPWIFVYAVLGLAVPTLVIDRVGPFGALGRGFLLSSRRGMRAATIRLGGYFAWWAVRLAFGAGTVAVLTLVARGADRDTVWVLTAVAWALVNAVAYPVLACLDAVLYLETRMRSEGLDLIVARARATGIRPSLARLTRPAPPARPPARTGPRR